MLSVLDKLIDLPRWGNLERSRVLMLAAVSTAELAHRRAYSWKL